MHVLRVGMIFHKYSSARVFCSNNELHMPQKGGGPVSADTKDHAFIFWIGISRIKHHSILITIVCRIYSNDNMLSLLCVLILTLHLMKKHQRIVFDLM